VKDDYYQPGGPIFMFLGGQADAEDWMDGFAWSEYADAYNAKMVVLEHRFYGQSMPVPIE
jgi:serine protease 16